jgi:hypothetical protein
MLAYELLKDDGILILKPDGALEASDFENVAKMLDTYLEKKGNLHGLLIQAKSFPGWSDFGAFISHLRFIRDHHRLVGKVAAVSDSAFLSVAPNIARHFVSAEVRHFDPEEYEAAMSWLREG